MMRQFSLRRVLAASMVLLAIVPAVLVAWVIGRAGSDNAIDLLYTVTWGQPLRRSTSAANENAPSDRPRK